MTHTTTYMADTALGAEGNPINHQPTHGRVVCKLTPNNGGTTGTTQAAPQVSEVGDCGWGTQVGIVMALAQDQGTTGTD